MSVKKLLNIEDDGRIFCAICGTEFDYNNSGHGKKYLIYDFRDLVKNDSLPTPLMFGFAITDIVRNTNHHFTHTHQLYDE